MVIKKLISFWDVKINEKIMPDENNILNPLLNRDILYLIVRKLYKIDIKNLLLTNKFINNLLKKNRSIYSKKIKYEIKMEIQYREFRMWKYIFDLVIHELKLKAADKGYKPTLEFFQN